ncbi:hypothetical protein SGHV026 [Glossina pallidipes salivary gland hypertrophy virus]|uniref:Uncharacterized protein n=1 Tax=Glossina hytrovirus (isolate Glossina pallidipes/Ethiopia/Seibersdorf/-) TaxID=379529 RepID=B0YLI0_GHVS|nr:hypothetical protein SGHV026 [Glossina pallidipes salivary gland hypertrophy virus]ABQ08799.1 hypothetical protein SGHV026 [Glossina pallidipes salivary gland hypertrophy virus]
MGNVLQRGTVGVIQQSDTAQLIPCKEDNRRRFVLSAKGDKINYMLSNDLVYNYTKELVITDSDTYPIDCDNWLVRLFPEVRRLIIEDVNFSQMLNLNNHSLDYLEIRYKLINSEFLQFNTRILNVYICENHNYNFLKSFNYLTKKPLSLYLYNVKNLSKKLLKEIYLTFFKNDGFTFIIDDMKYIDGILDQRAIVGLLDAENPETSTVRFEKRSQENNFILNKYYKYNVINIYSNKDLISIVNSIGDHHIVFILHNVPIIQMATYKKDFFIHLKRVVIIMSSNLVEFTFLLHLQTLVNVEKIILQNSTIFYTNNAYIKQLNSSLFEFNNCKKYDGIQLESIIDNDFTY